MRPKEIEHGKTTQRVDKPGEMCSYDPKTGLYTDRWLWEEILGEDLSGPPVPPWTDPLSTHPSPSIPTSSIPRRVVDVRPCRAQGHDVCRGRGQDAIDQVSKSLQRVRLLVVVAMPIVDALHTGNLACPLNSQA